VLRTGQSDWNAHISDELLVGVARDDEHLRRLRDLGMSSYVVVAIKTPARILGALTLVAAGSQRSYGVEDVRLAEEVARRAAAALENTRLFRQAQDAVRRKDEFMAMLGHELRNPLAPIQTALQLMRLRGDRHSPRERAVIERQMNHLAHLVDDLLDVSRITRGKIRLTKAPVELAEVLIRAIEMATPLLEQRAHRLVVEVPPEGMLVNADSDRLAQLFSNLLTNAAKYTEPHGNIRVSACWRDGFAEIEVVDDGIGIAPEMLPRIFELFVQSPQAIDRAQGGLGIGLKLVQSLVELHGGRVAVHSEGLGKGSRFMVSLPAPPEGAEASTAAAAGVRPADSGDRRRILVVDDNQDAADLLADILRAAGHQVESSYDGPNALARLTSFAPEVALLDIGLPVMDGYELAHQLRERLAGQIRLIAVTGYGTERDRERTREAGFEHHFIKPLDVGLLLAAIAGQPTAAAAE
jgi:signal transduction histidine kinase/ActR/RegA family two-component response regulator